MTTFVAASHGPIVSVRASEATPRRQQSPRQDWPLIGDILAARLDQPELLTLWTRRRDADQQ